MTDSLQGNRKLTDHERRLVKWMLEHSSHDAIAFLPQLDEAEVTPWRCKCGCASINFNIPGRPETRHQMRVVADFIFGQDDSLSGIFVYENGGVLSGLEVYGLAGDAPKVLPQPEELRPAPRRGG